MNSLSNPTDGLFNLSPEIHGTANVIWNRDGLILAQRQRNRRDLSNFRDGYVVCMIALEEKLDEKLLGNTAWA